MDNAKDKKIKQLIERISILKNISREQAKLFLSALETYCELIINYTLNNMDGQK